MSFHERPQFHVVSEADRERLCTAGGLELVTAGWLFDEERTVFIFRGIVEGKSVTVDLTLPVEPKFDPMNNMVKWNSLCEATEYACPVLDGFSWMGHERCGVLRLHFKLASGTAVSIDFDASPVRSQEWT